MHAEISDFISRMKAEFPMAFLSATRVLECGSLDINGTPKRFFNLTDEYVGIDWRPGPNVDKVSLVHEYQGELDRYFNFVISTSLLEHDPFWKESIKRMVELLGIGGSLLVTCAGVGFHQHELETSPEYQHGLGDVLVPSGEYYENLLMYEVATEILKHARFKRVILEEDPNVKDVRIMCFDRMPANAGIPAGMDLRSGVAV